MENFENEEWRVVDGFPMYKVSDLGRIYSSYRNGKMLSMSSLNADGYVQVKLYANGVHTTFRVHKIVCLNFLPNTENKPEINHKNGIKTDNRLGNLEWVTSLENNRHGVEIGLIKKTGEDSFVSKLTNLDVIRIRNLYSNGTSPLKIKRELGLTAASSTISSAARGLTWNLDESKSGLPCEKMGTDKGVKHYKAVLNDELVGKIREMARSGLSFGLISRVLDFHPSTVAMAAIGKNWGHLNDKYPPVPPRGKIR